MKDEVIALSKGTFMILLLFLSVAEGPIIIKVIGFFLMAILALSEFRKELKKKEKEEKKCLRQFNVVEEIENFERRNA